MGVTRDDEKAISWLRKAAEKNVAMAQNNLGLMYAEGRGVPKDKAEALKWYHKAAEQDLSLAQTNLGVMYLKGEGTEVDEVQAAMWLEKAAAQGETQAQANLAKLQQLQHLERVRAGWLSVLGVAVVIFVPLILVQARTERSVSTTADTRQTD